MPTKTEPTVTPFSRLTDTSFDGLILGEHLRCIWRAAQHAGVDGQLVRSPRGDDREYGSLQLRFGETTFSCGAGSVRHGAWPTAGEHINGRALQITLSKAATKALLTMAGVPTPPGRVFDAAHRDDALAFGLSLGGAVCVKPEAGAKGNLVFPECRSAAEIEQALAAVFAEAKLVLVERNVPGQIYRINYYEPEIGGVRINRPLQVVGDGVATIGQLAAAINGERLLRNNPVHPPIEHGEDTARHLARLGLSFDSVLEAGRVVALSPVSNFARGGAEAVSIGSEMHPSYLELAKRAFRAVDGLKTGGMDMAIVDCTSPATAENCAVLEINSSVAVDAFYNPWVGEPQDPAAALIRMLQREASRPAVAPALAPALDEHARLIADAADGAGMANEVIELPGPRGPEPYLRLTVGDAVFQYRRGAMRGWDPDDPAGPGKHINGAATRTTMSDVRTRVALRRAGLPVPRTAVFTRDQEDEAIALAIGMGVAVVRAPDDHKSDRPAVLDSPEKLAAAIRRLAGTSARILVEEPVSGEQLSFLVANGKAVAAAKPAPKHVYGDGQSSVLALLLRVPGAVLGPAHRAVCANGWQLDSVPEEGELVPYSRNASLANGRPALPDEIHQDYWRLAEQAAAAIAGVKICSVRMSVADCSAPVGAADRVLRVSSSPGIVVFCGSRPGRESAACNAILDVLKTCRP